MASLSGKTAAITGGAGGIGAAIAHRFAAEGATLALLDLNGDGNALDDIIGRAGKLIR